MSLLNNTSFSLISIVLSFPALFLKERAVRKRYLGEIPENVCIKTLTVHSFLIFVIFWPQ